MLKDITLGQYFPGNTVIHRLDPRTKLIGLVIYIVALFTAKSYFSYAFMLLCLAACVIISKIKLKALLRGLKPIMIILAITAILNIFFTRGEHVIVTFWKITITWEGVRVACFMIIRLMMLISGTFLLTYTTSPIALTDGLEKLLSPLKKIKLPVHELAMMMSIALRFIPTLIEETDKIMNAQKARGADFESGNLIEKAKAMLPLLVPLFISAFRRADELATAMESRCYPGGTGRPRRKELVMAPRDWIALLICAAVLAAVIVMSSFGL